MGSDELAIERWWLVFRATHKWSSLSQNCSTTVAQARGRGAHVDYLSLSDQAVWTPRTARAFAYGVQTHLTHPDDRDENYHPLVQCLPAGTPVHTQYGLKNIEEIQPGSKVWSFDHRSGEWALMCVLALQVHPFAGDMVTVTGGRSTVEATDTHPFWVTSGKSLEW